MRAGRVSAPASVVVFACLAAPAGAGAAGSPLGLRSCGENQGVYQCSGLAPTWDGVPLDTTVALPRQGACRRSSS